MGYLSSLRVPSWVISILVETPASTGQTQLIRATLPAALPQAFRAIHTDRLTPLPCSVPLPHSISSSGWSGECIAASAVPSAPLTPLRNTLPSKYSLPSQAPAALAPLAQSVSHPTYWVLCRMYIPLFTFPILLSLLQRVACLPNRSILSN
jgi:hypothetical protein